MRHTPVTLRIGCVGGRAARINEQVIDEQWTSYLEEHAELIRIPSFAFVRLFGGALSEWQRGYPETLHRTAARLIELRDKYRLDVLYVNWPAIVPYLMAARNQASIDLSFLFIAHAVGSEKWMKYWIAVAPLLKNQDTLLASTLSCKQALVNISPVYDDAVHIPLCIDLQDEFIDLQTFDSANFPDSRLTLLSIGRLEDVKNIDVLLDAFSQIRLKVPGTRLIVAGEYTGFFAGQAEAYQEQLNNLVLKFGLEDDVVFTGPLIGRAKSEWFRQSQLLINISTDPGETFGYNLLEAKAYGLPVVCTSWNGFRELVSQNHDGVLIDCDWSGSSPEVDTVQLVNECIRLLRDPDRRREMHGQAIRNARSFDYRRVMPIVMEAIIRNRALRDRRPMMSPELLDEIRICDLNKLYNLNILSNMDFLERSPFSLLADAANHSYPEWMQRVKPVIQHFAGRKEIAKL